MDQSKPQKEYPSVRIANAKLSAGIYLPDYEQGYYRGTRFDHAGIIFDLTCFDHTGFDFTGGKHRFFGEWFEQHDPYRHDGICGPVDEFSAIGYEDIAETVTESSSKTLAGSEFLKIGVGILRKSSNAPYDRFLRYDIVNPGTRSTVVGADYIIFKHVLSTPEYAYEYTKTIRLSNDKPGFSIEYELMNTGRSPLDCSVYNHNFFTLDGAFTGPSIEISFPFSPLGDWREPYSNVKIEGNQIRFLRPINAGESVFMGNLHGFDPAVAGYQFELKNTLSGAGVQVTGSGKLSNIVFWASHLVPCVEPYTDLNIAPGKTATWNVGYVLMF